MALEQYLNGENIKASTQPIDAIQLLAEDKEIIETDLVEIKHFDDPALDEVIEMHVYSTRGAYLTSDHTAEHWKHFNTEDSILQFDVYKNFIDAGITQGSYKLVLNFFRHLVGNDSNPNLFIKEISPDRTEIFCKIGQDKVNTDRKETKNLTPVEITTEQQLQLFQSRQAELCGDNGYVNYLFLNMGGNEVYQFVNYRYLTNTQELYIKLYQPLPRDVKEKSKFWIVQQVREPYTDNVVLYRAPVTAPTNTLKGPNFEIDVKYGKITETNFQNWNDLLGSSVATSQQIVDKLFSGSLAGAKLGIDYSGFQNFVHYSSAKERLENFKFKLELLEYYDDQIAILNNISASNEINANKTLYRRYKDNIIGGFDGFEQYMFNEQTGSFYTHGVSGSHIFNETFVVEPWPKEGYGLSTSGRPFTANQYTLHHTTSSIAETYYSGILQSASLWDTHNDAALVKAIPGHIRDDANNSEFETFVNMIGHHYDIMWSYVKHQTDIYNRDEHYAHGLSKDLLYDVAKSFGWHLINGNQQERLFEYLLGTNELGEVGKLNERKIDKDLVLYVPFDEGRPDFASKNFVDYSLNKNLLEDYNVPKFIKGAHGHGAQFDGTNFLKYNTPTDYGTSDYAISFWIKDLDATNAVGTVFSAMSGSGIDSGFRVAVTDGKLQWLQTYTGSNGSHFVNIPATTVNNFSSSYLNSSSPQGASTNGESNGWHHVVFNIERQTSASAYVDGVFIDGADISVSSSADIGPEILGDYPKPIIGALDTNNTGDPFQRLTGSLDEFRVYKRALSVAEITELYNDGGLYLTQSSAVATTIPKEEMTHQVWRRIVNNLPHLLKTKGTSRSVKALLSCYGIPESLLSIREYGGPKMPATEPVGIYDQFTYALDFTEEAGLTWKDDYYNTDMGNWGFQRPFLSKGADIPVQTREWRFRPATTQSMLLWSTTMEFGSGYKDVRPMAHIGIEYTGSYSGSSNYGRVIYTLGRAAGSTTPMTASTDYVPLYDGNFWNIRSFFTTTGSDANIYNTGQNLNTTYHVQVQQASDYVTGKIVHSASLSITPTHNDHYTAWSNSSGTRRHYLGGTTGSVANGDAFNVNSYHHRMQGFNFTSGLENTRPGSIRFSGSMQEYREWLIDIGDAFDKHTLNPKSYVTNLSPSSSYDTLVRHYPLGTNQVSFDHSKILILSSSHPNQDILDFSDPTNTDANTSHATASNFIAPTDKVNNDHYSRVDETYYIHGPSIGGKNLKSEKIRLESNKLVHPLSRETRGEVSAFDTVSNDSNRLGIFFSPQDMINKDIFNQIGGAALDDFFGSPGDQYKDEYPRFKKFAHEYWKKYENDNDINAYIRIFALFDFSFFTQLKQLIPIRTNADTGLIVEPSVLERSKVVVEHPPKIEKLMYDDSIPDPFFEPTASTLPLEKDIDAHFPVTGTLLPLEKDIRVHDLITGSYAEYKTTMYDVYTASAEILGQTGSVDLTNLISSENITIHRISTGSDDPYGNDVRDPGLDLFGIASGYKGAEYNHVSIFYDTTNGGWVTQSRHPLENSPTGSVILEQRKDPAFKKKVFSYAPEREDVFHYPLNKRHASGQFLDQTTNYLHSVSHSKNLAGTSAVSDVATPKFETVTHNRFTGQILTFSGSVSSSQSRRGSEFVSVPNHLLGGKDGYKKQWSLAWLMRDAHPLTASAIFSNDHDTTDQPIQIGGDTVNLFGTQGNNWIQKTSTGFNIYHGTAINSATLVIASGLPTNDTSPHHYVITYDGRVGTAATYKFYQDGKLFSTVVRDIAQSGSYSASLGIEAIGGGYFSGTLTYGFTGSMGHVRTWNKALSDQEISYVNRYPHLRVERDYDNKGRRGRMNMTRRLRSNGYGPLTDLGTFATSASLVAADYRQDSFDNSFFEGSKLTATAINEFSDQTTDGQEVVKVTVRNRYSLIYKKDLPSGANLDVE
tara:strand:+ start:11351 stop:17143 length:5793 start_codon:yes stop_codon:yes gene_type:complete